MAAGTPGSDLGFPGFNLFYAGERRVRPRQLRGPHEWPSMRAEPKQARPELGRKQRVRPGCLQITRAESLRLQ